MPAALLAYAGNRIDPDHQTKRCVIYKHKIYLFQAYYLQRINRISYCLQGAKYLTYHKKRKRLRYFLVKKFGYIAHFS